MKLEILIIVLDGEPYLRNQVENFHRLKIPWHLNVVHGVAANVGSTAWCKQAMPRFSRDGTTEYLNSRFIKENKNITVFQRQCWQGGKDEMVNKPLPGIKEESVLLQVDVDEFWKPEQIEQIVQLFEERPTVMRARFFCRYFIGKNIVSTAENTYGNRQGEWLRAFRFRPGMMFNSHEPPVLDGNKGPEISRIETRELGLVFDHYAWALESQAVAKEKYYGYTNAAECWNKLQENTVWPCRLKDFFHWADDGAIADKLK